MFDSINTRSHVAVYVQIENLVQFAIASGKLKAGDQLPSIIELSKGLGVNFNTVSKAYRDLEVRGFVSGKRGEGVYVNTGVEVKCRERCRRQIAERLHEAVAEARTAGMSPKEVGQVAAKSYASAGAPYGATPESLLALAKSRASTS